MNYFQGKKLANLGNLLQNEWTPSFLGSNQREFFGRHDLLQEMNENGTMIPIEVEYFEKNRQSLLEFNIRINNSIEYTTDKGGDNWQSPYTTMQLSTGDCEDIAILKMYILMANNWDCRLLGVKNRYDRTGHVVLAVYLEEDSEWVILDNAKDELGTNEVYGNVYEILYSMNDIDIDKVTIWEHDYG